MSRFYYFILFGAPGSGKGTQSEIISKEFNLLRVSPGEIFRKMISDKPKDKLSIEINEIISKGNLVSNNIIKKVLVDYVYKNKKDYIGVIFDGFPRNLDQDNILRSLVKKGSDASIYLETSPSSILLRLESRVACNNCGKTFNIIHNPSQTGNTCDNCDSDLVSRNDDQNEAIINERFRIFNEQSMPVIERHKKENNFFTIDADREIDVIAKDLSNIFKKIIH